MSKCADAAGVDRDWSFSMFDRHWLGDLALAVLLVLPLTGLAESRPATHQAASNSSAIVTAANLSPSGRIGLFG
jgi:hypothetical protein